MIFCFQYSAMQGELLSQLKEISTKEALRWWIMRDATGISRSQMNFLLRFQKFTTEFNKILFCDLTQQQQQQQQQQLY